MKFWKEKNTSSFQYQSILHVRAGCLSFFSVSTMRLYGNLVGRLGAKKYVTLQVFALTWHAGGHKDHYRELEFGNNEIEFSRLRQKVRATSHNVFKFSAKIGRAPTVPDVRILLLPMPWSLSSNLRKQNHVYQTRFVDSKDVAATWDDCPLRRAPGQRGGRA